MATEIRVPTLGESVTEATVATWFKKPGESVGVDEMLCELETDKVTVEVPSPAAGTLSEIVAVVCRRLSQGGAVVINTVLVDSLHAAVRCLKDNGLRVDVSQVQVSRSRPLAGSERMEALNPVWIIRGQK